MEIILLLEITKGVGDPYMNHFCDAYNLASLVNPILYRMWEGANSIPPSPPNFFIFIKVGIITVFGSL